MARKRNRKRTPAPPKPTMSGAPIPIPPSLDAEPSRGKIRRMGARLFNAAVDTTLENFWIYFWSLVSGAIGPALMAMLVAVILYLRSPESAWVYSLLKYTFVFLAGALLPVVVLVSLALVGVYRKKRRAQDRVHKYTSKEKAWVDYDAELAPVMNKFIGLIQEIGRETIKVGHRSGELIRAILITNPQLRRTLTSKKAKALNKHCLRMEIAGERLAEARDAFFEVAEGILKSTPTASQGNGLKLAAIQESINELNVSAVTIIKTQNDLIEQSKAVHGRVSMDVNTSMNWLVAVCENNVRIMDSFKDRMSRNLIPLLRKKLES